MEKLLTSDTINYMVLGLLGGVLGQLFRAIVYLEQNDGTAMKKLKRRFRFYFLACLKFLYFPLFGLVFGYAIGGWPPFSFMAGFGSPFLAKFLQDGSFLKAYMARLLDKRAEGYKLITTQLDAKSIDTLTNSEVVAVIKETETKTETKDKDQ